MKVTIQTARFFSLLVIGLIISSPPVSAKPALLLKPALTLEIAQQMAQACQARQIRDQKPPVNIAIYDQGANLILFYRMTGATLGTSAIAMEKGKSSAHFPIATRQWAKAAYGKQGSPGIAFLPNITVITGGLPIKTAEGTHLGGIGVSGSSGDDDEACAQTAIDAVKDALNETPS